MKFRSILTQLANDEIQNALETFEHFFHNIEDIKKELLLIQANHHSLKKQERLNLIEHSDLSIEKNRLRKSLLEAFAQLESLIEEKPGDTQNRSANKPQTLQGVIQEELINEGYEIISQIYADQSSYYFKAKRNSFVQNDFYIVQVLNWYKLNERRSGYNQKYLDFFSRCPQPFVNLIEFHPGKPSYIIRKYAQGIDLNRLVQSGIKLSLLKALDAIISISKGLKKLSDVKIFYNNMIPDQIILNTNWNLHILPLNIFEENVNIVTWENLKQGIKFMSPEQLALTGNKAEQNKLTIRSSQFSLGLILFYVLTGESLFDGKGLPSLYADRINQEDTKSQLISFFDSVHSKLLHYCISDEVAQELQNEFTCIFMKLIQNNPSDRYELFEDFISKIEFLKLRIEHEKKPFGEPFLYNTSNSFYRAIVFNDNILEEFYHDLMDQLPPKKSMKDENKRNIRLQYALDYLFSSVSNLKSQEFLADAVSCLVKNLHADFTIEEYEIFFKLLKKNVQINDSDWNDKIDEAWDHFMESSLNAVDAILNPIIFV